MKKPEIKETKGTLIIPKLKSSYWGPFSGLKSQNLIKTSRTFSGVIFCPRSFINIFSFNWTSQLEYESSERLDPDFGQSNFSDVLFGTLKKEEFHPDQRNEKTNFILILSE